MNLTQRYNAIVDNFDSFTYHILGCGAIGSSAATQLVRMGATNLNLYDMDIVGNENIGVSMFSSKHIGLDKTEALQKMCLEINQECDVRAIQGEFERHLPSGNDFIILGFDSMSSRLEAVTNILNFEKPEYLIDGRMGAEHYQQYVFKKPTLSQYKLTWYSDEEGDSEPCNAKATSYCSNMSGSFISNTIRKILMEQPYYKEFSFNFPTMYLDYK
tara:strand:- start:23042 stop:23686 length:645 start_codon:yes stop_codon:yes gene_type:complete